MATSVAPAVVRHATLEDPPSSSDTHTRRALRRHTTVLNLRPRPSSSSHAADDTNLAARHARNSAPAEHPASPSPPLPGSRPGSLRRAPGSLRNNRLSNTVNSFRARTSAPTPIGVSIDRYDTSLLTLEPTKLPARAPLLQPQASSPRPTLVLDLDETLLHSTLFVPPQKQRQRRVRGVAAGTVVQVSSRPDFSFKIGKLVFHVAKRPGADAFLRTVARKYEVVIFSASSRQYVDACVQALDPTNTLISASLCRSDCTEYPGGYFVKDLSRLGRNLATTVIVDNSLVSFILQPENAILVTSWVSRATDIELSSVCEKLDRAAELTDVRKKKKFST